jgi:hypothetical protein
MVICDMAVQHLTLWISNIMAVKSAMIMKKRDTQASLKDYKRDTGVAESKGSMDYFVTQGKVGNE